MTRIEDGGEMIFGTLLLLATLSPQDDPATQLRQTLAEVAAFEAIEVTFANGVIELSGTAPSTQAREDAAAVAKALDGVLYVENLVALPMPPAVDDAPDEAVAEPESTDGGIAASAEDDTLRDRLRSIYSRVEELEGLQVEAVAGVVRLSGEVTDSGSKEQALELARAQEGAAFVDDDIEVTADLDERLLPSLDRLAAQTRDVIAMLPLLVIALGILALFWWFASWVAARKQIFSRMSDSLLVQSLVRQVTKAVIILFGAFLALELLDATALVGAVLGSVGVLSLALGLAFRDIAENYLASIILSVRRPFRTKDVVKIEGETGVVIRMTTRETVLMTFEGNHVLFPNSTVFKSKVTNFSRSARRRFKVGVGFGTDVDLRQAIELGTDTIQSIPGVMHDPAPSAAVEALGESNVLVNYVGWVDQRESDFTKVRSEAIRLVKETMDEHGLDMPAPMYQVEMLSPGGAAPAGTETEADVELKPRRKANPPTASDVSIDRTIEDEVDRDLAESQEEDLLSVE